MNDPLTLFIQSIKKSRLFSPEQKREFLENPLLFPIEYRPKIIDILALENGPFCQVDDHIEYLLLFQLLKE